MATRIEIEYNRRVINSLLQEIIARATVTVNVLSQLGTVYQSLPGMEMAAYEAEVNALEALLRQFDDKVNELKALLEQMDDLAEPLNDKNQLSLATLSGILQNSAQLALLDQITGATPRPASPPAGPTP